ncbi:MAG: VOC family protein [Acidobacteria bacterium]|nr:VOC family protein [Acidobacteriota bacterium]
MLDHTGFVVTNLDASRKFYDAVAKALGLQTVDNGEHGFLLGKGPEEYPYLWIGTLRPSYWKEGSHAGVNQSHVAFRAKNEAMVRAFHKAAIEAGGTDFGAPGPREGLKAYFGAFVLDPDGNNIEACFRKDG